MPVRGHTAFPGHETGQAPLVPGRPGMLSAPLPPEKSPLDVILLKSPWSLHLHRVQKLHKIEGCVQWPWFSH